MNTQATLPGLESIVAPFRFKATPYSYRIVALKEALATEAQTLCDTPDAAAAYWRTNIPLHPHYDPETECFTILLLNTRRRVKAHHITSTGTHDTLLVHPIQVFRLAVMTSAAAIILMHNHPSGDPTPSEADIKVTRDLVRAGQILKIEVLDHVIVGTGRHCSLRELGFFNL